MYAQQVPAPIDVLRLALFDAYGINHLRDQALQVWVVKIELEVPDGASHISPDQVQQLFRRRSEAADAESVVQHQDGYPNAADQIGEVAVEPAQIRVLVVQ